MVKWILHSSFFILSVVSPLAMERERGVGGERV
jgi:hypothetical protein